MNKEYGERIVINIKKLVCEIHCNIEYARSAKKINSLCGVVFRLIIQKLYRVDYDVKKLRNEKWSQKFEEKTEPLID